MALNKDVTLDPAVIERAARFPSATLHEAAGRTGDLPAAIKPIHPDFRLCGPAYPVSCPPGSNLQIHHAVQAAAPGDVLVVDVQGGLEWGYWGEILSEAARAAQLGGLVINGSVRDRRETVEVGFPIFATGLCIRGTDKNPAGGTIGLPIQVGRTAVAHGDLVVGDIDGVVVLPAADAARVLELAAEREAKERTIIAAIRRGESTVALYHFPSPVLEG
jgi:4-hydroxy-4-methyl-2-oxoglutarate aldolase